MQDIINKIVDLSQRYLEKKIIINNSDNISTKLKTIISEVKNKREEDISNLISNSDGDAWTNVTKTQKIHEIVNRILKLYKEYESSKDFNKELHSKKKHNFTISKDSLLLFRKDSIISKLLLKFKNNFIIVSVVLITIILLFIFKSYYSKNQRNNKIIYEIALEYLNNKQYFSANTNFKKINSFFLRNNYSSKLLQTQETIQKIHRLKDEILHAYNESNIEALAYKWSELNKTTNQLDLSYNENLSLSMEKLAGEFVLVKSGTFNIGYVESLLDLIYSRDSSDSSDSSKAIDSSKASDLRGVIDARTLRRLLQKPAQVHITKDYYIGKYEVTQKLWSAVMGENPSFFNGDYRPVEQVSWEDCQLFIAKLNEIVSGSSNQSARKKFRLPTEAEWEYAARGGHKSKGYIFSGSNNINEVAWYSETSMASNSTLEDKKGTMDVGLLKPNELGLYDMTGNVNEWVYDRYAPYPRETRLIDYTGSSSGINRVIRGGSWRGSETIYVVNRFPAKPQRYRKTVGFRLVYDLK